MSNALAVQTPNKNMLAVESALVKNDISKLSDVERMAYYNAVCESVNLNPLTKPFAFLSLQGKVVLYATKDCTEQLRKIHGVSTQIVSHGVKDDCYEVHIKAKDKTGREDEDISLIPLGGSKGADLANLKMKAITKAKRRVTLSICGLGVLDVSELETIHPSAKKMTSNPQIESPFKKEDEPEFEPIDVTIENTSLGQFVCKVGKKYNGRALDDIDQFELSNYLEWLNQKAHDTNQPLRGDWLEFATKAEEYLKSKEPKTFESAADELK